MREAAARKTGARVGRAEGKAPPRTTYFLKGQAPSLGGLEPPTFRLTAERANRLRHRDTGTPPFLPAPPRLRVPHREQTHPGQAQPLAFRRTAAPAPKPGKTGQVESTQHVGSVRKPCAGRLRRQKGSRGSPPRLAPHAPRRRRQRRGEAQGKLKARSDSVPAPRLPGLHRPSAPLGRGLAGVVGVAAERRSSGPKRKREKLQFPVPVCFPCQCQLCP